METCTCTIWTQGISVFALIVSLCGVYYTRNQTAVSRKLALLSSRMKVYLLLKALVETLGQAVDESRTLTKAIDFATSWLEHLWSQQEIKDFVADETKRDAKEGCLLLDLRKSAIPQFEKVRFIFDRKSIDKGVDAIWQQLKYYATIHENVGKIGVQFSDKQISDIRDAISSGKKSLSEMEKEMRIHG